jgi:hypothetical protein
MMKKKEPPSNRAQSPQEAAKPKEIEVAKMLSKHYTKSKQKALEEIHQQALNLQREVNSLSGKHKALVQAVNDFLVLTEKDIRLFHDALSFIHGVDPKLPKYSFIGVAEAEGKQ